GVWYPHARDPRTLLRILYHECVATAAAMRAIRAVRPDAELVQTDDLGRVFSTPLLSYQAEFENERRWLAFDMLCGRLVPGHALWCFCVRNGLGEAELMALAAEPCRPAIIGI